MFVAFPEGERRLAAVPRGFTSLSAGSGCNQRSFMHHDAVGVGVGLDERVVEKWRTRRELEEVFGRWRRAREGNFLPPISPSSECSFSFGSVNPDGIHLVEALQRSGHRPLGTLEPSTTLLRKGHDLEGARASGDARRAVRRPFPHLRSGKLGLGCLGALDCQVVYFTLEVLCQGRMPTPPSSHILY